jgi:ATP-dependent helicase/nuclease subunit B
VSGAWLDRSPSYAAGLSHGDVLASEQEWRIRAVLAGRGSDVPVDEVLDRDEVARRAMAMIRGWASDVLTRFDGDVSGHGIPGPADAGQVVSPTALETWSRCPHAYFVQRLLRVEPPRTPEELVQISPLEAGSLILDILPRLN